MADSATLYCTAGSTDNLHGFPITRNLHGFPLREGSLDDIIHDPPKVFMAFPSHEIFMTFP